MYGVYFSLLPPYKIDTLGVEISGELDCSDDSNCKALDRFSLNKANPLYVKGVNAPTLAERQASQGS